MLLAPGPRALQSLHFKVPPGPAAEGSEVIIAFLQRLWFLCSVAGFARGDFHAVIFHILLLIFVIIQVNLTIPRLLLQESTQPSPPLQLSDVRHFGQLRSKGRCSWPALSCSLPCTQCNHTPEGYGKATCLHRCSSSFGLVPGSSSRLFQTNGSPQLSPSGSRMPPWLPAAAPTTSLNMGCSTQFTANTLSCFTELPKMNFLTSAESVISKALQNFKAIPTVRPKNQCPVEEKLQERNPPVPW